jgi:hypothetical protein
MVMAKPALKLIALVLIATVAMASTASAAGTATFSVTPGSGSYVVGDTLSVTISEDSGTQPIGTVQADLLYPTTLVQYKNVDGSNSAFADIAPAPSNSGGKLSITRASMTPYTGTQQVAVVNFTVIASGSVTLGFADTSAIYTAQDATNIYAGAPAAGSGSNTSSAGGTTTPQSVQSPVTITTTPSTAASRAVEAQTVATPTPSTYEVGTKGITLAATKTHTSVWVYAGLAVLAILLGAAIVALYFLRKRNRSKPQVV